MTATPTPPPAASDGDRALLLAIEKCLFATDGSREPCQCIELIAAHTREAVSQAVGALEAKIKEDAVTIGLLKSNLFDEGANFSNLVKDYEELGDTLTVTREERDKADSDRESLRALVVRLQDALKDTQEVIDIVKDFEVGEAEGPCAANRAHAIGLIVESALISVAADLSDCVVVKRRELPPFKFGDAVECRSVGDSWIQGFRFIAYVPEWPCCFIVKGDTNPCGLSSPIRAHRECRKALSPEGRDASPSATNI